MDNNKKAREGEILMLLVKRSGKEGKEVAASVGITPGYLSTLYKSEIIRKPLKKRIAEYFGIDVGIFDTGLGYEVPFERVERVGESDIEYTTLMEENARLKEENVRMAEELLREKALSDDLRKVLVQITTQGGKDGPDDSMHFVSSYGRGRKVQKSG